MSDQPAPVDSPAPETPWLLRCYRLAALTRALDDRIWALSRQGRVGIVGPCRGHEAAQVASVLALRPGRDLFLPYYRDIGVALALGFTPLDVLLGALDRATDPFSGSRQMPFHYTSRRLRVPTPSTSIGTQLPHAVGLALAERLRGGDGVVIVYFGDGAASKADFHEALNFAAVHRLPVVFFCENNQYAISVPVRLQMAVASVADRAPAYGIAGQAVDGWDAEAVHAAVAAAAERARAGCGPTLIEARVYRFLPHTSADDDSRYRSPEEVAAWQDRDPLPRLRATLLERGLLDDAADRAIVAAAEAEVDAAQAAAEAAPDPDPATATLHVWQGVPTAPLASRRRPTTPPRP